MARFACFDVRLCLLSHATWKYGNKDKMRFKSIKVLVSGRGPRSKQDWPGAVLFIRNLVEHSTFKICTCITLIKKKTLRFK